VFSSLIFPHSICRRLKRSFGSRRLIGGQFQSAHSFQSPGEPGKLTPADYARSFLGKVKLPEKPVDVIDTVTVKKIEVSGPRLCLTIPFIGVYIF